MQKKMTLSFSYAVFDGCREFSTTNCDCENEEVSFFVFSVKKSLMLMHRAFFHLRFGESNLVEIFFLHDGLEENLKTLKAYGDYCNELIRQMLRCLPMCMYVLLDKKKMCEGCCISIYDEMVLFACSRKEFANFHEKDKEMIQFCIQIVKKDVYFQRYHSAHCFLQKTMDLFNLFSSQNSGIQIPVIVHEVCKNVWENSTEYYVHEQIRTFCKRKELPESRETSSSGNFVAEIRKRYKGTRNACYLGADGVFQEELEFHYLDYEKKNRNFYHSGCRFCFQFKT